MQLANAQRAWCLFTPLFCFKSGRVDDYHLLLLIYGSNHQPDRCCMCWLSAAACTRHETFAVSAHTRDVNLSSQRSATDVDGIFGTSDTFQVKKYLTALFVV